MRGSKNGRTPKKTTDVVAAELRERLEQRLGAERTEAILRDPTNVRDVLRDEEEAASVAGIILQAWRDLPEEEPAVLPKRRSAFKRGLQLALIAAVAVWALSIVNKARHGHEEA